MPELRKATVLAVFSLGGFTMVIILFMQTVIVFNMKKSNNLCMSKHFLRISPIVHIRKHTVFPEEFPEAWASDWGEDEYGLWMAFTYKGVR